MRTRKLSRGELMARTWLTCETALRRCYAHPDMRLEHTEQILFMLSTAWSRTGKTAKLKFDIES